MLLGTQKANVQRNGISQGVSALKIQELQAEAEQYFNEEKYLQSVKVVAQIAASCDSKEYTAEIVAKFNQVCVTDLIVKSKFKAAAQILKEVLKLVQEHLLQENEAGEDNLNSAEYENLRRLTLNNLGCALKKCGQVEEAEQYFSQISTQDPLYELNLCAVQNKKQNHRQALIHAQQAATLLETELNELRVNKETQGPDTSTEKDYFLERTSLLAIAYYNQGCELENLDNLIRATQAFSRAVNLISGSQANQQLLSQLKLSLKQARYKLKQQMLPTSQNYQKNIIDKNAALLPKSTKDPRTQTYEYLGKYESKDFNSFDDSERPYSAVNMINHVHFAQKGSPGQIISKVQEQTPVRNEKGPESTKAQRKTNADHHELLSQNSQLSNSKKDAFVDQMIQRPTATQDQKLKQRGVHQASQSGSRSNSLRQKQAKLQLNQANLGTFIPAGMHLPRVTPPVKQRRNSSASATKSLPKQQSVESLALPKLDQHKHSGSGAKNLLDGKGSLGFGGQTLFAAKATFVQNTQQQSLPRVTESSKPPIQKNSSNTQIKQVPPKKVVDPKLEQQKLEKCVKLIQSYIKRRRFRKLVHAMIIRRKIQQGKLKHQDLSKIEKETLLRLQMLDKKQQAAQLYRNTSQTHLNAVKMIQRLFRVKKFRATIQAIITAKRELEKNGLREYLQNAQKDAFIEIVLGKANAIRKKNSEQGAFYRTQLIKAAMMVQSWYRRRKFRRAVNAMILLRKIRLGQVKVTSLNKIDKNTYEQMLKLNKQRKTQETQAVQLQKKEKAARMVQSLFRRHRFRSIVNCVIQIQKKARGEAKSLTKKSISTNQRQATFEKAMQLRQKEIEQKKEERMKIKKAVKFIQSWIRRRKFRKIVQATIILKKYWQGQVEVSALTSIDPKLRDNILKAHRTQTVLKRKELAQEAKKLKAIRLIQRYVRRRKFRQLVRIMVQVAKNGAMQKHLNKQKILKGPTINQFDERMRFIHEQRLAEQSKTIEQRAKEKKAGKMIKALVQRYRFRKLINNMILLRKYQNGDLSKKIQVKSLSVTARLQLALIAKVKKEQYKLKVREETCARMIQSMFRRRRFRRAVEAMMIVAKRIREQNSKSKYKSVQYEIAHKQRLEEAKLVRKQLIQNEAKWRAKRKAAAKLIQGYIRRRNFRRLIQAIILQNKIKAGKASPKEFQQLSTYIRKNLESSEKKRQEFSKKQDKLQSAARLIQGWYRRRKFRKIVEAVICLKRINNPIDGKYKNKKIIVQTSFDETIKQANQIRKKKQAEEIEYRKKLLKAVKMVQRWFRRNKFRKLVFAMIVKKKVQAKKLSPSALKEFSKQTIEKLEQADKRRKELQINHNQQQRAAKLIQRWYRAFRFRIGYKAFVQARSELNQAWKSTLKQPGMIEVYFNRVEIKAKFIRNRVVSEELKYRQKLKKAARMVQSYYRRRQFRKSVYAMIQLRKQTTSKAKATFLSKLQEGMRRRLNNMIKMQETIKQAKSTIAPKQQTQTVTKELNQPTHTITKEPNQSTHTTAKEPNQIAQTTIKNPPAQNVFNNTMLSNFTAPTSQKAQSYNIKKAGDDKRSNARSSQGFQGQKRSTHSQSSLMEQTPMAETSELQSSQKIVIDYWYNGLQVAFQPGFAKKKPILMVSLILNQQTQDRKILSLDLYQLALDAGALDLKHFCDKQIMPCLQIKEKNGQFKLKLLQELIQELVKKTEAGQNIASEVINPANQSSKKTPGKKLTGMLPLIKKQILLNNKVYTVQAICDFDIQMMKLTAEREDQYLFTNVQVDMSTPQSDLLKSLCSHAEDLVHQLIIIDEELRLRKAAVPTLHDEEVFYRSGKLMEGRFYLVNIGQQNGKITIEALDKERELRLVLQLGSQSGKMALNESAIGEILEKLDTHCLGGEKILVIR